MTQTLDSATLRKLYEEDGLTIAAIAQLLHVRKQTICDALAAANIPRRRRGPRRELPVISLTPQQLRAQIAVVGMGALARYLNVRSDVIMAYLNREPLPRGTRRVVDDVAVWEAYEQGMLLADMERMFQCSYGTIFRSLRRTAFRLARTSGNQYYR